jgi:hypothetical protein
MTVPVALAAVVVLVLTAIALLGGPELAPNDQTGWSDADRLFADEIKSAPELAKQLLTAGDYRALANRARSVADTYELSATADADETAMVAALADWHRERGRCFSAAAAVQDAVDESAYRTAGRAQAHLEARLGQRVRRHWLPVPR